MTISETLKKRWYVPVAILGIIIILLIWAAFASIGTESFSSLYVYKLNGSDIPQGNIISLTEEDFTIFPKLVVIRDNISWEGSNLYFVDLTSDEYYFFKERYMSPNRTPNLGDPRFFEYKGKYYSYHPPARP